jgi:alkylhydroperoxidase/carboxymuconolactone decarboxylase family protein YurZ
MMANGAGLYRKGLVTPKLYELIAIAIDASYTHMFAPSTRRHVKLALKLGATIEEIMTALEICVSQVAQTCNLALPVLAEELAAARDAAPCLYTAVRGAL